AYSVTGGLYEALVDTAGEMYAVTNHEADRARHLFETLEGIDICPASGVATAALIQAVEAGKVGKQDCILLNITSGGTQRMQQEHPSYFLQPNWVIPAGKPWFDELPG
ncbi:cysteate synthase, partial [filamentous cyanobacterium CCP1]